MTTVDAAWRGRRTCEELKAAAAHSGEQGFISARTATLAVPGESFRVERCAEEC